MQIDSNTELVSVIIPTYNRGGRISNAIESALNQTYTNIEVIVIDDGSTDNTQKIMREHYYRNEKVKYYYQDNNGVSTARNKGILKSKGAFIAFLDSDDSWEPNKLELQVSILKKFDDVYFVASKQRKSMTQEDELEEVIFKKLLYSNSIVTSSVLLKKEVFNYLNGFKNDQKYSEDYNLWLRLSFRYRGLIINRVLVKYDNTEGGLSSNLWEMEKGELSNYWDLFKEKKISFFQILTAGSYSCSKYMLRYMKNVYRKLRCRC